MKIDEIFAEIKAERDRQKQKWSKSHDANHSVRDWIAIIGNYATKLLAHDPENNKRRFIQIAAVCVAAIEVIFTKKGGANG